MRPVPWWYGPLLCGCFSPWIASRRPPKGGRSKKTFVILLFVQKLLIVYSSTSGHTEYVLDVLLRFLKSRNAPLEIRERHVETIEPKDLLECDILLLASSTWNSTEGLLPPDFAVLVRAARSLDLQGKPTCVIGLGDDRYRNTCKAAAHLMQFAREHNGKNLLPPLPIVNEPYDQNDKVEKWGEKLLAKLSTPASSPAK